MKIYNTAQNNQHFQDDSTDDNITCPFCKETDFDLIGLKSHLLNGDCDVFNNIETIKRLF